MIIKDEGYILNAKKYGEKSLILTLVSKKKGKLVGFVKDGTSKRNRGFFQASNKISFEASARLEANMWAINRVELLEPNAVLLMADIKKLDIMTSVLPMFNRLLNENENEYRLYNLISKFFKANTIKDMLLQYSYFEFYALEYLGLGLSLDECAVTGVHEDLTYISPKTGRAVCKQVGLPYHDKLYNYPTYIIDKTSKPNKDDIINNLKMTEYFVKERFFKFHNLQFPKSRANLCQYYQEIE